MGTSFQFIHVMTGIFNFSSPVYPKVCTFPTSLESYLSIKHHPSWTKSDVCTSINRLQILMDILRKQMEFDRINSKNLNFIAKSVPLVWRIVFSVKCEYDPQEYLLSTFRESIFVNVSFESLIFSSQSTCLNFNLPHSLWYQARKLLFTKWVSWEMGLFHN